ncbi:hypothetical protein BC628DRAFT_77685 [Trametes gibbosa]|nr:hypothetical protein BC628DRAFT_77685 [Trametes gibbosa]
MTFLRKEASPWTATVKVPYIRSHRTPVSGTRRDPYLGLSPLELPLVDRSDDDHSRLKLCSNLIYETYVCLYRFNPLPQTLLVHYWYTMRTVQSVALVAGFTVVLDVFALPLRDAISSEVHAILPRPSSTPALPAEERPDEPRIYVSPSPSVMSEPHTTRFSLLPGEDAGANDLPVTALPSQPLLLARDNSFTPSDASAASCQAAEALLRDDFAGHGLPLTSLVIESSTFLFLAGFVLYSILWRCKLRRRHNTYFSTHAPWSLSFHRDSVAKHTPSTPTQLSVHSLSKIDEDSIPSIPSLPSTPTHTLFSQTAPTFSPLRGTPFSPARSVARSASNVGTDRSLEKKSSFLSLKG